MRPLTQVEFAGIKYGLDRRTNPYWRPASCPFLVMIVSRRHWRRGLIGLSPTMIGRRYCAQPSLTINSKPFTHLETETGESAD